MPSLSSHHSSSIVKLLYIGNSGTGKTGSLVSLVKAGYKIGMLDFDNGIDVLAHYVRRECPEKIDNVKFISLRDERALNQMNQLKVKGQPKAFVNAMKYTTKWDDDTIPAEWGSDWIFVLDTLGTLGTAAHDWAEAMNPMAKEPRTWINGAQRGIESYISMLTSPEFKTNVIVISHVRVGEDKNQGGMVKGYASSVGTALGPILPKYFNNLLLTETSGSGKSVKRVIKTLPTGIVDLKTSAPFKLTDDLPIETGLATVFEKLKETD